MKHFFTLSNLLAIAWLVIGLHYMVGMEDMDLEGLLCFIMAQITASRSFSSSFHSFHNCVFTGLNGEPKS